MKTIVFASIALGLSSASINAEQNSVDNYSVAEYCELAQQFPSSKLHANYLKSYAEKLGNKPSRSECNVQKQLSMIGRESFKRDWNYFHNTPYQGSVIRLTHRQVELLRSMEKEEVLQFFSSLDK
ncbi:MAG: hypothetical protein HWE27_15395 [Gammaproteobacteria bacterium]|nr:hypothetical protein [Gammaproteobacteria bacterium]